MEQNHSTVPAQNAAHLVLVFFPTKDFIKDVINNPHEREKLQDATAEEIVQASKDAGYEFTISDLDDLIQHSAITGKQPGAKIRGRPGYC